MKILPNNKISNKNLDFRLKLAVMYNADIEKIGQLSIANVDFNGVYQNRMTKSSVVISDKKDNPESGLDIDFEIERTIGEEPNKCTLTIWNLSESTFNQIANKSMAFYLYYARGENDWSLLFAGSPYFSTQGNPIGGNNDARGFLKRDDAVGGENDIPTTIYLEEAVNQYENAIISKSYQGYVSSLKVIQDCANTMGLPYNISGEIGHISLYNFVARGFASDILENVVSRLNTEFGFGKPTVNYDNNVVNVFVEHGDDKDKYFVNDYYMRKYAYLFNESNSTRPEKEQHDKEEVFRFETQLLPDLSAGNYCKCEFSNLSGSRQIKKVISTGNNYGTEGKTEVYVNV